MTRRKQNTKNDVRGAPASALDKPLEEGINKEKLRKFRELLSEKDGLEQVGEMLKDSPDYIRIVAELLGDNNNPIVRKYSAKALGDAARNGADIAFALDALVKALADKYVDSSRCASETLWALIRKNKVAIEKLSEALSSDDADVRWGAGEMLVQAARKGFVAPPAIDTLSKLCYDKNEIVRSRAIHWLSFYARDGSVRAIDILVNAMCDPIKSVRLTADNDLSKVTEKGTVEMRVMISKAILNLTNSGRLMREAEKNSKTFIDAVKIADELLRKIDKIERKAA